MPRPDLPPFEFLLTASRTSLQSYRLAKMNASSEARKDVRDDLDKWVEETALSLLADWLEEYGPALVEMAHTPGLRMDFLARALKQSTQQKAVADVDAVPVLRA